MPDEKPVESPSAPAAAPEPAPVTAPPAEPDPAAVPAVAPAVPSAAAPVAVPAKADEASSESTAVLQAEEVLLYGPLMDQLKDEQSGRREAACWLLGELRYKSANKAVSRILTQDPDALVRFGAAQSLEKLGDGWSVQAIIRGLKDADALVREACVFALAKLRDKQAVYPLEQLVKTERDADLRALAESALKQLAGAAGKTQSPWERKVFKYLRVIEREPQNANAHYNLAVTYFYAKRFADARRCCERARELGANVDWIDGKLKDMEAQLAAAAEADDLGGGSEGHEASFEAPERAPAPAPVPPTAPDDDGGDDAPDDGGEGAA